MLGAIMSAHRAEEGGGEVDKALDAGVFREFTGNGRVEKVCRAL